MNIIVATDTSGGIGIDNTLPWRCRGDLRMFRALTMGNAVIMGRKTFESIGGPLPDRQNIVLTSMEHMDGVEVANNYESALSSVEEGRQIWIIGGGSVYRDLAPISKCIIQNVIQGEYECDTFFEVPDSFTLVKSEMQKSYDGDPGYETRIFYR